MKKHIITLIATITIIALSCSDNEDLPLQKGKCYIKKIVWLDENGKLFNEKTFTYTNDRVTSFIEEDYQKGSPNINEININYNSNNQIISLSDGQSKNTITYNANGLPAKQTIIQDIFSREIDFFFNASKQLVKYVTTPMDYGQSLDFEYPSGTSNNFKKIIRLSSFNETYIEVYEYDDMKNILESLGWLPLFYEKIIVVSNYKTDNNIIKETGLSPNAYSNKFTYQYNDLGYPTSIKLSNNHAMEMIYDCK